MTRPQAEALLLAGRLMTYPNAEYLASLPAMAKQAAADAASGDACAVEFAEAAGAFAKEMGAMAPHEAAQRFVAIFDHTPAASLYMTWHRYGNDRSQGQAMAALNGLYRSAGFEPLDGDMPDYLPRMLEFLSVAPDWARDALLDGFGPELAALHKTLAELEAPHAPILGAALAILKEHHPERFKPRTGPDPTKRPMARPEPEPLQPLIPIKPRSKPNPERS